MPAEGRANRSGRWSVFVYYTLAADKAPDLRQAAARLGSVDAPWRLELMRRADVDPQATQLQTWMEVYTLEDSAHRDPAELRHLIEVRAQEAGILDLIDGTRHYEVFETCA